MYTISGSYEKAIAFLEGYISGMAKANPRAEPVVRWMSFLGTLLTERNGSKADALRQFRNRCANSRDAVQMLANSYSQFRSISRKVTAA